MKFTRKILKNGVNLLLSPMKDSTAVTVLVMVKAGSKYETKANNGISHFLEHMCFKGTTRRPNTMDIVVELDAIGSQYNAFTSQEFTGYYAKSHPKHIDTIIDVVSDIYVNPVFDPIEIEKEKGVIIEEINMYEDMPHRQVQELFLEVLYGDQPAGWPVIGPKENIIRMTQQDFIDYRAAHYVADATTVIVAGNFDNKTILKKINAAFGVIPVAKKSKKVKISEVQTKPLVFVKQKDTDQSHVVLGVRTFKASDKRNTALKVLDAVLGGGMSSRLWQKIREEMGVGYYIRSGTDEFTDHGYFSISIGADPARVPEVVSTIIAECNRLVTTKVSAEELEKAKEYIIGNMYLSLESSDSVAEFYGLQEMSEEGIETPEKMARKIREVTAEEIQKLARFMFRNEGLALTMIGKNENTAELQKIVHF